MKIFILISIIFILLSESCSTKKWVHINKDDVVVLLKSGLLDTSLYVSSNAEILVPDEETAINIAEPILFNLYGKNKIIKQRPYRIGQANGYWIIIGSLPKYYKKGGFFEIIINSQNAEVIEYSHGK